MAEKKTNTRSGNSGNSGSSGGTGRSRPSKKSIEAERQRQREEAIRRSLRRRHIATVIMFAAGIFLTLAAVIPAGEGEGWRAFFDFMHYACLSWSHFVYSGFL